MMILLLLSLAAAEPKPTPTKLAANSPDKVICREFPVTGSLVSTYKECKTRREWDIERERLRSTEPGVASCSNANPNAPC